MTSRCAEYGDLLDYVKNFGYIKEPQANLWFYQLASAIKYLHSLNIAHRDLKCENILISKHLNLKIADFGFSRDFIDKNGDELYSSTFCGSAAYASPEVVGGTPYHPDKADIWAMGIVLFIILHGSMPFNDSNLTRLREDQNARRISYNAEVHKKLSLDCQEVLHKCLTPNPKDRPSIDAVLKMKWLEKRVFKDIGANCNRSSN
jgi:testis-specific serine kinase